MTALDVISPRTTPATVSDGSNAILYPPRFSVEEDTPVLDLIHKLIDSPQHRLVVKRKGNITGHIDPDSLLEGIADLTDCHHTGAVITAECATNDYSASSLARAVEDADANLLDFLSKTTDRGTMRITMRISHEDPSSVCRSLERYNYNIISAHGTEYADEETLDMRLNALQVYLNV